MNRRIENRWREDSCRVVTRTALLQRRDVVHRFRRCDTGRVTGCAIVGIDTGVVENDASERRIVQRVMAR